jgi:hypothetical protein
MPQMLEMLATAAFAGLVIAWAALGRSGLRGRARVFAIAGAALLFAKSAVADVAFWYVDALIADTSELGEPPAWQLLLAKSGLGSAGGLLYAAGLAALAAALFTRHGAEASNRDYSSTSR